MSEEKISRVQIYKSDVAFKTLVEGVNNNLYYIPKYQRGFVWSKKQVQELIRSLVKGYPIPPIYGYRNQEGQLEILDGQQRIMSFFFYYIGKFTEKTSPAVFHNLKVKGKTFKEVLEETYELTGLTTILNPEDNKEEQIDISYDKLSPEMRHRIDYTNITVIELRWDEQEDRGNDIQTIFKNLNNMGTLLTPQEVRNGVYDGAFYDMLRDLNYNNQNWRKIWGDSKRAKDEDMEFLLRLCTVKYFVSYESGNFIIKEYTGKYSVWLDRFSEKAMDMDETTIKLYKNSLERFFAKFNISSMLSSQKALLESLYIVYEKCGVEMPITDNVISKVQSTVHCKNARQDVVKRNAMNERWKGVYGTIKEFIGNGS